MQWIFSHCMLAMQGQTSSQVYCWQTWTLILVTSTVVMQVDDQSDELNICAELFMTTDGQLVISYNHRQLQVEMLETLEKSFDQSLFNFSHCPLHLLSLSIWCSSKMFNFYVPFFDFHVTVSIRFALLYVSVSVWFFLKFYTSFSASINEFFILSLTQTTA